MKDISSRRRAGSVVVATALAGALLVATQYAANASESAAQQDQGVAVADAPEIIDDSGQVIMVDDAEIIEGGTTQSTDATRDDYVPQFQTLNANGVAATSAFKWTWGGVTISVPGGWLGHRITGDGLRITQERTSWGPALNVGQICNYQFRLQNVTAVESTRRSGCRCTQAAAISEPRTTTTTRTDRCGPGCNAPGFTSMAPTAASSATTSSPDALNEEALGQTDRRSVTEFSLEQVRDRGIAGI